MCPTCAMTAVAAASGTRAVLATRRWGWLTPGRLRAITAVLGAGALAGSVVVL